MNWLAIEVVLGASLRTIELFIHGTGHVLQIDILSELLCFSSTAEFLCMREVTTFRHDYLWASNSTFRARICVRSFSDAGQETLLICSESSACQHDSVWACRRDLFSCVRPLSSHIFLCQRLDRHSIFVSFDFDTSYRIEHTFVTDKI